MDVFRNDKIGKCLMSGEKFAKFQFKCAYSQLYKIMHLAYMNCLLSQYEVRNIPAYIEYKNVNFLLNNSLLDVYFYMPIQLM
jgi:hypothetical protein